MPAAVPHLPLYLTYLCTMPAAVPHLPVSLTCFTFLLYLLYSASFGSTLWLLMVSCQGYLSSYTGVAITTCFILPLSAMVIASCTPLVVPGIEVPTSKVVPDVDLHASYGMQIKIVMLHLK